MLTGFPGNWFTNHPTIKEASSSLVLTDFYVSLGQDFVKQS
jgi:hypothetical protein